MPSGIVADVGPRCLGRYANNPRTLELGDAPRGPAPHQTPPGGRNVHWEPRTGAACVLRLLLAATALDRPP